jgi:hypothetical protein
MSKPLLGVIFGGVLGAVDGLTALFYPETAPLIAGIVFGSTIKGLIAGIIIGYFARKVQSTSKGILFGLGVGLVLAFLVAAMQNAHYVEIMIPGSLVGAIVGYATQRYGKKPEPSQGTSV